MKEQEDNNDLISFFVPIDVEKGKDKEGKDVMKIKGIASTTSKDDDGEELNPAGFNLKPFLSSGFFSFNHQSKNDPMANVGEPTKAIITPDNELYVEGELYGDNPLAHKIYQFQQLLEKSNSTRRLGYSIEGRATKRDPFNKKKVLAADIFNVTICPLPKNPGTLMQLMKGTMPEEVRYDIETDDKGNQYLIKAIDTDNLKEYTLDTDFNLLEKSLEAGSVTGTDTLNQTDASGAGLKTEDVEGSKKKKKVGKLIDSQSTGSEDEDEDLENNLTKADVFEYIFTNFTEDLEKGKAIFNLISNISQMSSEKQTNTSFTMEDINRANEILDLVKGKQSEVKSDKKTEADWRTEGKAKDICTRLMKKGMKTEDCKAILEDQEFPSDIINKVLGDKKEDLEKGDNLDDEKNKKKDEPKVEGVIKEDKASKEDEDEGDENEEEEELEKAIQAQTLRLENIRATKKAASEAKTAPEDALTKGFEDMLNKVNEGNEKLSKGLESKVGDLIKGITERFSNELEEMKESFEAQLSQLGDQAPPRKSVQTTNYLEKGNQIDKKEDTNITTLSCSRNKRQVVDLLESKVDYSDLTKGTIYADTMIQLESGAIKNIPQQLIREFEKEGVRIVG